MGLYSRGVEESVGSSSGRQAGRFTLQRPRRGPWLQLFDIPGVEWNVLELTVPGLDPQLDGVRMLHVGDLHLRARWMHGLDAVIERVKRDPPELVLYTGDFVDDRRDHGPAIPRVAKLMADVRGTCGTFGVLGNHDGDFLLPRLTGMGVRVIIHERVMVPVRGASIELIGFPGPERLDLNEGFLLDVEDKTPGVPRVILSHYPDLIRAAKTAGLAPDLFLAGHTHGGQMCPPNGMPIMRHDSLPRWMCTGVHDFDGTCLVVTRGLGFSNLPIRLWCPAEVVEVVLRKG